ncbi:hypothetical protein AAKU67_003852, partial [Oxalobacteraceae bacterium GrIS 2.11]
FHGYQGRNQIFFRKHAISGDINEHRPDCFASALELRRAQETLIFPFS